MFTIREIIDELLTRWNLPEEQLKQYLKLSRVINELSTDNAELKMHLKIIVLIFLKRFDF
ncbi:hypothetical protein AAHB52_29970 [Bacillus toyonensis]